ncbi:MAG: Holliday junction resolvase RuvX [Barnesiella sp.]|nr:Holliday junction resolvase RuvX [Barnesiella sp.]
MGRLLSIDYGRRRCGIAVTDPLRIVASGLTTVDTSKLIEYIRNYVATEQVDAIIVGYPTTMRGQESDSMRYIRPGIGQLRKALPQMEIIFFDERFTSAIAHRAMLDGGMKKSARRDKAIVDEISATIILNDYLESQQYNQ